MPLSESSRVILRLYRVRLMSLLFSICSNCLRSKRDSSASTVAPGCRRMLPPLLSKMVLLLMGWIRNVTNCGLTFFTSIVLTKVVIAIILSPL